MKEKNRFSSLLKHLMTVAKLKNYTLAKELRYDESYISKWVNGTLMPTERTYEKVLREISRCIVGALDEESLPVMQQEYQLTRRSDLELAIYDNLEAEYTYVLQMKEETGGAEITPKTLFFPELTLAQFITKMRHPVLRHVKELDIMAAMDILPLDRHYQLTLSQLENSRNNMAPKNYPGVHYSLLINLDTPQRNIAGKVPFLLNLLTDLSDISFQLYSSPRAVGKLVMAVKDAYSISGMIIDENHCLAVTASEDVKNCNAIYDRLKSLCVPDQMIIWKTTMEEMVSSNQYAQFLFARNQRWILGRVTEHFLPDDLFEELAQSYCSGNPAVDIEELRKAQMLSRSILREVELKFLVFEDILSEFGVSGEVDFFNQKVYLTAEQRLRCLEHIEHMLSANTRVQIRTLRSGAVSDIQYIPNPTCFLSDSLCFLRLARSGPWNYVGVLKKTQVCDMFRRYFDTLWNDWEEGVRDEGTAVADMVRYVIRMVKVQLRAEGTGGQQ